MYRAEGIACMSAIMYFDMHACMHVLGTSCNARYSSNMPLQLIDVGPPGFQ